MLLVGSCHLSSDPVQISLSLRRQFAAPILVLFHHFQPMYRVDLCHCSAAKSLQSYPTLCDPIDDSPPGSPVPGILQARVLEWGAIAFSGVDL